LYEQNVPDIGNKYTRLCEECRLQNKPCPVLLFNFEEHSESVDLTYIERMILIGRRPNHVGSGRDYLNRVGGRAGGRFQKIYLLDFVWDDSDTILPMYKAYFDTPSSEYTASCGGEDAHLLEYSWTFTSSAVQGMMKHYEDEMAPIVHQLLKQVKQKQSTSIAPSSSSTTTVTASSGSKTTKSSALNRRRTFMGRNPVLSLGTLSSSSPSNEKTNMDKDHQ